jgi:hypothetical protein
LPFSPGCDRYTKVRTSQSRKGVTVSNDVSKWKLPEIPGLKTFKGDLVHTASWPKDFRYAGKRVAVIGNGSSGVQVVPAIQKGTFLVVLMYKPFILTAYSDVSQLVHFIRSPLWVMPPPQQLLFAMESEAILKDIEMDGDRYTPEQIEKFTSDPEYHLKFVKIVEEQINSRFPAVRHPQQWFTVFGSLTDTIHRPLKIAK